MMMLNRIKTKIKPNCGQMVLEFVFLFALVILAIVLFERFIVRAIGGRYHQVGQQMGDGRVFDPNETIECAHHHVYGGWYDPACFEANCEEPCFGMTKSNQACKQCIRSCDNGCQAL